MMSFRRRDPFAVTLGCVVALGVVFVCNGAPLTVESAQEVLDEALGEGAAEVEAIRPAGDDGDGVIPSDTRNLEQSAAVGSLWVGKGGLP